MKQLRVGLRDFAGDLIQLPHFVVLEFPNLPDGKPIEASVSRQANALDPTSRMMRVEVDLPNPQGALLPGMFGQARLMTAGPPTGTVLPAQAIRFDESGEAFVYVVSDDQTVSVVPVMTGVDTGVTIEVVSGVKPGQLVVDAHRRRFRDGEQVRVLDR